jgi:hypothetical protein
MLAVVSRRSDELRFSRQPFHSIGYLVSSVGRLVQRSNRRCRIGLHRHPTSASGYDIRFQGDLIKDEQIFTFECRSKFPRVS